MTPRKLAAHFVAVDPVMAGIVSVVGKCGLTKRAPLSVFETLACSIANQQISGVVAQKILGRLRALHGDRFPTPAELAGHPAQALRDVGFSFSKVAALQDLAAKTLDGTLPPDEEIAALDDEAVIERCTAVRGVGRWTVEMLLMFSLGRPDVLPVGDFGVCNGFRLAYGLKGMPRPKALLEFGERWRPYRSAAAWYLWRAVDLHREGGLPKRQGRAPRVAIVIPKTVEPKTKGSARK